MEMYQQSIKDFQYTYEKNNRFNNVGDNDVKIVAMNYILNSH